MYVMLGTFTYLQTDATGGVASLLAMMYLYDEHARAPSRLGPVKCITFGTAANMSRELADCCEDDIISVIHEYDTNGCSQWLVF